MIIDTNVLVSALFNYNSPPQFILSQVYASKLIPILNEEILNEYTDVLYREKFHFDQQNIKKILSYLKTIGTYVDRKPTAELFTDEKDVPFYETLEKARELYDAYLVTGNMKHFPAKSYIVSPREMLEIIEDCDIVV